MRVSSYVYASAVLGKSVLQKCFIEAEWPFTPLNLAVKKQTGTEGLI